MARPTGRPGFTLIEMLVVMAIIAVLMALLLPTVKRSKEHTKAVLCQSNLRQFTFAMRAYSDEQKQYMPMPIHKDPRCCWDDAWYQTLDPYVSFDMDYNNVSKPKTMACPAADEITSTIRELWGYHLNPNVTGYDDDPDDMGSRQWDPTDIYVKRDLITHQSKTPFMFDASGDLVIGRNPYESWYGGFPPGSSNDFKFRHPGGVGHIAMINAHVEGIRGTYTGEHSSIDSYNEPDVPAELLLERSADLLALFCTAPTTCSDPPRPGRKFENQESNEYDVKTQNGPRRYLISSTSRPLTRNIHIRRSQSAPRYWNHISCKGETVGSCLAVTRSLPNSSLNTSSLIYSCSLRPWCSVSQLSG